MWGESLHDGLRCPCDDREVGSRSDLRCAPAAFPVLDGIEAESEGLGKPRLGNVDLKALAITDTVDVKSIRQNLAPLRNIVNIGNADSAAISEALEELDRRCAQVDPESDVEAAQIAGLMFFYRSHAVPDN
jgi:hypothetical protein